MSECKCFHPYGHSADMDMVCFCPKTRKEASWGPGSKIYQRRLNHLERHLRLAKDKQKKQRNSPQAGKVARLQEALALATRRLARAGTEARGAGARGGGGLRVKRQLSDHYEELLQQDINLGVTDEEVADLSQMMNNNCTFVGTGAAAGSTSAPSASGAAANPAAWGTQPLPAPWCDPSSQGASQEAPRERGEASSSAAAWERTAPAWGTGPLANGGGGGTVIGDAFLQQFH